MTKKRGRPKKIHFLDKYEEITEEIEKRRGKWFLQAIPSIGWEDVRQIIIVHVNNKWHLWDQKRPLMPWVNRIITNQLKNLLRNHYGNFVRPCSQCPFNASGSIDSQNEQNNKCSWTKTGQQDANCPLFEKWSKTKKYSQNINMAGNIEDAFNTGTNDQYDFDQIIKRMHQLVKENCPPKKYEVYKMLYIDNLSNEDIATKLGYKTNERGRRAGYKQIKNFEKYFKSLAKKLLPNLNL